MTPEEAAERIVLGIEQKFVAETLAFLLDQLIRFGSVDSNAEYWLVRMASENPVELAKIYLKYKNKIGAEAAKLITEAMNEAELEKAMLIATSKTAASPVFSASKQAIINATIKGCTEVIGRMNVALTASQAQLWYDISSEAITKWTTNTDSRRNIMERAVRKLAENGLKTVEYKSGSTISIDAGIRRHIDTQVSQNNQRLTDARAQEFGWDLFFCSSHPMSRPEHYDLQGKLYSMSKYIGQRIDGYRVYDYAQLEIGSVTGICGANCRHYVTPYVQGYSNINQPPYSYEENERRYNLSQKQRAYEREIRKEKAVVYEQEQAGFDATESKLRLRNLQSKNNAFCKENELVRQYERERAYGIDYQPRAY